MRLFHLLDADSPTVDRDVFLLSLFLKIVDPRQVICHGLHLGRLSLSLLDGLVDVELLLRISQIHRFDVRFQGLHNLGRIRGLDSLVGNGTLGP